MYAELLAELDARDRVPLSTLRKGDYCKLGSNCLKVVKRHKSGACDLNRVSTDGLEQPFVLALSGALLVTPLSPLDVETAIRLRKLEDIKPYDPFDGLTRAVAAYMQAERKINRS